MDVTLHVPGTTEPPIAIHRGVFSNIKVFVDGTQANRRSRVLLRYDIPLLDGSVRELWLKGQWTGWRAVVDGVETAIEPRIPWYGFIAKWLPIVLVSVGWPLGAIFALGPLFMNYELARREGRWSVKVGAMLGVTTLAAVLLTVITTSLRDG